MEGSIAAPGGTRLGARILRVIRRPAFWFFLTGGLAAYLIVVYSFGAPPIPLIYPDSSTYWLVHKIVPIGYPAIIHGLYAATGSLKSVVVFQVVMFCTAVLTLQAGVTALTRNAALAGVLALLLFCYHGLLFYALAVLTDELFIVMLILHVAAAAFAMARDSKTALVAMALTAVLAISLRPAAYFLFGGTVLLALVWHGHRLLVLRWAILPLVLFMSIYVTIGLATRGVATQTFTGVVVFPWIAYLYDGGGAIPPEAQQQLSKAIEPFREERDKQPNWRQQADYERDNYLRVFHAANEALRKTVREYNNNDVMASLAFHTIVTHPFEYAKLAARAMARGFLSSALGMPRLVPADIRYYYQNAEAERARLDLEKIMQTTFRFDPKSDSSNYFLLTRYPVPQIGNLKGWRYPLLIWTLFLVTASWALLVVSRFNRQVLFTAYAGALLIGAYLQLGLTIAIIDRYALPLDALVIVILAMGVWMICKADWPRHPFRLRS